MKTRRRPLYYFSGILTLLLFTSHLISSVKPARMRANIDKTNIHIGDIVQYRITIESGKALEVEFPDLSAAMPGFEIKRRVSKASPFLFFAPKRYSAVYTASTFSVSDSMVGPMEVKYRRKGGKEWKVFNTPQFILKVESLLKDNPQDIKDIKPPIEGAVIAKAMLRNSAVTAVIALVMILAAGLFCTIRKVMRRQPKREIPLYETIQAELKKIRSSGLIEQGKTKEYYLGISNCLRKYLEKRLSLPAPEMTTEEFLHNLQNISVVLMPEQKKLLEEFLRHCDMVKFAKYEPSQSEAEATFQSAYKLIEEMQ
ncbi:MAG: hypothetical protein PHR44_05275 [Candidatus Omnitrophica bacterium]|nr:hypothetical protein [Candidatus Omnitrophota bacterium]